MDDSTVFDECPPGLDLEESARRYQESAKTLAAFVALLPEDVPYDDLPYGVQTAYEILRRNADLWARYVADALLSKMAAGVPT